MIGATCGASCAFMLPVATAPNAIVYGTGKIKTAQMMKAGFALNIISIIIYTLFTYFMTPIIWNLK
jgi:sodium-dependent dicarboxylate transporter 2/3/5